MSEKMTIPRVPKGLQTAGKKLWRTVTSEFELAEHEQTLLLEACRTVDNLAQLDAIVSAEGVTSVSPQGVRAHPALVEARQQRVTLAKLWAALKIPDLADEPGVVRGRGVRGAR